MEEGFKPLWLDDFDRIAPREQMPRHFPHPTCVNPHSERAVGMPAPLEALHLDLGVRRRNLRGVSPLLEAGFNS